MGIDGAKVIEGGADTRTASHTEVEPEAGS